jgi:putative flippase GtrA
MNPILRWARFNAVGAMGMVLQLAALAAFNRLMAGHSLCAIAAAVELTVVHNFLWHRRYTWRDRASTPLQFVRFQLSNGMVSLVGNLALMRLLDRVPHLPLLAANLAAILCCSVVNFILGNRWVFARANSEEYIL